eukprot:COSAG06_NODE_49497_length_325_cov_0.632743_1_plen_65_part_10
MSLCDTLPSHHEHVSYHVNVHGVKAGCHKAIAEFYGDPTTLPKAQQATALIENAHTFLPCWLPRN